MSFCEQMNKYYIYIVFFKILKALCTTKGEPLQPLRSTHQNDITAVSMFTTQ